MKAKITRIIKEPRAEIGRLCKIDNILLDIEVETIEECLLFEDFLTRLRESAKELSKSHYSISSNIIEFKRNYTTKTLDRVIGMAESENNFVVGKNGYLERIEPNKELIKSATALKNAILEHFGFEKEKEGNINDK